MVLAHLAYSSSPTSCLAALKLHSMHPRVLATRLQPHSAKAMSACQNLGSLPARDRVDSWGSVDFATTNNNVNQNSPGRYRGCST